MEAALKISMKLLPFVFGMGFLAPVIAAGFQVSDIAPPFGLAPLAAGFLIGGSWGLFATVKGRWL